MRRCRTFRSPPGFFGLIQTPKEAAIYRKNLFRQIFDLTYHGKGFIHDQVYGMPIWMRRNYIQLVSNEVNRQNKEQEAQQASHDFATQNQKNPMRPDIKSKKNIVVNPKYKRR